jgi:hypothetical protein
MPLNPRPLELKLERMFRTPKLQLVSHLLQVLPEVLYEHNALLIIVGFA